MEFPISLRVPQLPLRLCLQQPMNDEELLAFCRDNEALRIEREPSGEISIMSPSGFDANDGESEIHYQLISWAKSVRSGRALNSNAGFTLRDGAMRAPDACWVSDAKADGLTAKQRRGFPPICPEFVIELRSPSDRLPELQAKMREWISNGAELAWLIDPERQMVEVYRPGAESPDLLEGVTSVMGEGPVAGFILELTPIWNPA
jgi:Uma2 family endonuclease